MEQTASKYEIIKQNDITECPHDDQEAPGCQDAGDPGQGGAQLGGGGEGELETQLDGDQGGAESPQQEAGLQHSLPGGDTLSSDSSSHSPT